MSFWKSSKQKNIKSSAKLKKGLENYDYNGPGYAVNINKNSKKKKVKKSKSKKAKKTASKTSESDNYNIDESVSENSSEQYEGDGGETQLEGGNEILENNMNKLLDITQGNFNQKNKKSIQLEKSSSNYKSIKTIPPPNINMKNIGMENSYMPYNNNNQQTLMGDMSINDINMFDNKKNIGLENIKKPEMQYQKMQQKSIPQQQQQTMMGDADQYGNMFNGVNPLNQGQIFLPEMHESKKNIEKKKKNTEKNDSINDGQTLMGDISLENTSNKMFIDKNVKQKNNGMKNKELFKLDTDDGGNIFEKNVKKSEEKIVLETQMGFENVDNSKPIAFNNNSNDMQQPGMKFDDNIVDMYNNKYSKYLSKKNLK